MKWREPPPCPLAYISAMLWALNPWHGKHRQIAASTLNKKAVPMRPRGALAAGAMQAAHAVNPHDDM